MEPWLHSAISLHGRHKRANLHRLCHLVEIVEFCHSMQTIDFMGLCLMLQVLVSIQSLILVPEPYFNEPGYEILLGTAKGKRCSQSYNEEVLLQTVVHAMVAQLRKPCSGFEDVIRTHFWIKKKRILTV